MIGRIRNESTKRDNYTCQICRIPENGIKLHPHHIDYNKKNNDPSNLISLCRSCHAKTNFNRNWWTKYFQVIIKGADFNPPLLFSWWLGTRLPPSLTSTSWRLSWLRRRLKPRLPCRLRRSDTLRLWWYLQLWSLYPFCNLNFHSVSEHTINQLIWLAAICSLRIAWALFGLSLTRRLAWLSF